MRRFAVLVIMLFMLYPVEVSAQLNQGDAEPFSDSYVPVIGNTTVTLRLTDAVLPGSWSGEVVTVNQQLRLDTQSKQVGILTVKMTLHNFTGGQVSLVGDGQSLGATIQPNAVDDVVSIQGLEWRTFSYYGQLQQGSTGFGREMAFDVRSGSSTVGRLSLAFELIDPMSTETDVKITREGNTVGSGSVVADAEPFIDQFTQVTNLFAGFVTSKNGRPVQSGVIRAVVGGGQFSSPIAAVGEKGGYGFQGRPMVIAGITGSPVDFYFGDYKLETAYLTSEGGVRRLDLMLPVATSNVNFPDWDLDGVPDFSDLCPASESSVVDSNGCTCAQLVALKGGRCEVIPGYGPKWFPPAPPPPPKPECDKANSCIKGDTPKFCTENKTIVQNCNECGCPTGFSCNPCPEGQTCITDGGCYKVVERVGLQCLKNNYVYGPGMNCSNLGPTWVDFFAKDPLARDMTDFVNVQVKTGTFGGSRRDIREQIQNNLRQIKLCVNAVDLGCVPVDVKCPGEVTLKEDFRDVSGALGVFMSRKTTSDLAGALGAPLNIGLASVGAVIGAYALGGATVGPVGLIVGIVLGAVIGLIGAFFAKVSIKFSLNTQALRESQVRVPYGCDPLLLTANQTCKSLINNGDETGSIDVLFMSDGYTAEEFEPVVKKLLNYDGNASGTRDEGLFSREPFKKNKRLFNIWTIVPNASIGHVQDEFSPSLGKRPNLTGVVQAAAFCPQRDFVFVVSKSERYQSDCSFEGTQPCVLSMKDEGFAGRQVLRLMAKALGGLSDEWVFEKSRTERTDRVLDLENVGASRKPNCQPSTQDARDKWGDKIGAAGGGQVVGLFEGCGGDCGEKCENNYRPVYNSALRNWTQKCAGEGRCVQGPPFDPFFIVNDEALIVAMQEWGDAEQQEDEERVNASQSAQSAGSATVEEDDEPPVRNQSTQNQSSSFKTHQVKIEVFAYDPVSLRVNLKDKVTWVNRDAVEHTITGTGFNQKIGSGESFTRQFNQSGNIQYHCEIHPEMQGTIAVG